MDGLRGYAVLLVFLVHFFGAFAQAHGGVDLDAVRNPGELRWPVVAYYWLFYSHYGVYLFFCISGFVIARALRPVRTASQWRRFMLRRVLRIYPAFLASLVLALGVVAWLDPARSASATNVLENVVFLNGLFALDVPGINAVTWSLFFEFVFYVTFSAIVLLAARGRRHVGVAAVLWPGLVGLAALLGYRDWLLFVPFAAGALSGALADTTLERLAARVSDRVCVALYLFATSSACLFVALPLKDPHGLLWSSSAPAWIALASGVFVLLIVRSAYGTGTLHRFFGTTVVARFGRASFSFFLVHALAIQALFMLIPTQGMSALAALALLGPATLGVSTILAWALHRGVELPLMWRSRAAPSVPDPVTAAG